MSFLVKTLLGDDIVHPTDTSKVAAAVEEGNKDREEPEGDYVHTRKLITRIQSCTVAQDRREALRELRECVDLPYVMEPKEVVHLCNLLQNYSEDGEVVESSLAILANVTDLSGFPTGPAYAVSERGKQSICDSFLQELVSEVPLFLSHMKEGSFWSRFHALQLLQRLEDYDPSSMNKLLLASQGVSVLVDILSDNSHDGALRNEGLVLITAITATDTELQTVLAFNNAFEKLFGVMRDEGDLDGGAIVSDCLTITHNMLRGNKATQKLFCEMGCAKLICPLLFAVVQRLQDAVKQAEASWMMKRKHGEEVQVDYTPLTNAQNMATLMAVSVLSCVLRDARAQPEGGTATQESFLQCGVLTPLASLALVGDAVDDAVRVEAMRTLATLLEGSSAAVEEFLQLHVLMLLRKDSSIFVAKELPAARAALHLLLGVGDRVMQPCVAQVFLTLLSTPSCEESAVNVILKRFALPVPGPSGVALPKGTLVGDCGEAIAAALFSTYGGSDCVGKYYAALLLDRLLMIPTAAVQLLEHKEELEASSGSPALKTKVFVSRTHVASAATEPPGSVLVGYVEYVLKCFRGHGEMDLNTLSACFRALLQWIVCDVRAIQHFLKDTAHYRGFLQRACRDEGPVHVRFWSAILCAAICVYAPENDQNGGMGNCTPNEKSKKAEVECTPSPQGEVINKEQLLELFFSHLGGPQVFEDLLFDVRASSPMWGEPPKCAFQRTAPALYDEAMKGSLLKVMKDFSDLCRTRMGIIKAAPDPKEGDYLGSQLKQSISAVTEYNSVEVRSSPPLPFPQAVPETPTQPGAVGFVTSQPSTPVETTKLLDETVNALREQYESKIRELTEKNAKLESDLHSLEEQIRADARQREEEEALREERHRSEVGNLNENIAFLEGAVSVKEEEHQALAQSLNMLEEQLRAAVSRSRGDTTETLTLRQDLQKITEERDQLLVMVVHMCEERGFGSQKDVQLTLGTTENFGRTDGEPTHVSREPDVVPFNHKMNNGPSSDDAQNRLQISHENTYNPPNGMPAAAAEDVPLNRVPYNHSVTLSDVSRALLREAGADSVHSQISGGMWPVENFNPSPAAGGVSVSDSSQCPPFGVGSGVHGPLQAPETAPANSTSQRLGGNPLPLAFNPFANMGGDDPSTDLR